MAVEDDDEKDQGVAERVGRAGRRTAGEREQYRRNNDGEELSSERGSGNSPPFVKEHGVVGRMIVLSDCERDGRASDGDGEDDREVDG